MCMWKKVALLRSQSHLPELFGLFPPTSIVMADSDHIPPGRGKPFPDIFLAAAKTLGKDVGTADECTPEQAEQRKKGIIFEDAVLVRGFLFVCAFIFFLVRRPAKALT